jgi:hypothetical protein
VAVEAHQEAAAAARGAWCESRDSYLTNPARGDEHLDIVDDLGEHAATAHNTETRISIGEAARV